MSCKRPLSDRVSILDTVTRDDGQARNKQARTGFTEVEDGTARALHSALFRKHPPVETPPNDQVANSREGGILAFGTMQAVGTTTIDPPESTGGEIPSQELLLAAVDGEGTSEVTEPACHIVQVFREMHEQRLSVLMDKNATVGSITVAEERIGSMRQPIAVYTCIGSPMKLSDAMSPCMQVFLQDFSVGQRGTPGVRPQFFAQTTPCSRIQALWNQEAWVATDEMNHYLAMIASANPVECAPACAMPAHVEDDEMETILHDWFVKLLPTRDGCSGTISALLVRDHWFPVVVKPNNGKAAVLTTPAGMSWIEIAIRKQGIDYSIAPVAFPLAKFNNDCGFQTVAWLMDALLAPEFDEPLHRVPPIETNTAIAWRQMFERQLVIDSKDQLPVIPCLLQIGGASRPTLGVFAQFVLLVWSFARFCLSFIGDYKQRPWPTRTSHLKGHPSTWRRYRPQSLCMICLVCVVVTVATCNLTSWPNAPVPTGSVKSTYFPSKAEVIPTVVLARKETLNSHRKGRKDPQSDYKNFQKIFNQPGTGTQEPEKTKEQPGSRTQEPDKQTGSEAPELGKTWALETLGLHPPIAFQAMPPAAFVPGGPSPHPCFPDGDGAVVTAATAVPPQVQGCPHYDPYKGSIEDERISSDFDAVSLMAMGKRSRLPDNSPGAASEMPEVAFQEEEDDDAASSDSDTSSVSDPNWQNTELFTVIQSSVIRQLNIPHANLRRMQIASALSWATASIAGEYPLAIRPADMVENQIRARLIRHVRDLPPHHTQQLILVDVEFHPPAPRFDFERVRMPIYALQFMTAIGFVRAMYLLPYCQYAELPCFLWRNGVYWSLEDVTLHQLQNGDYLRIVVPPPNPAHHECHPRSLAAALHMGLHPATLPLTENLMGDVELQAMPNPYRILIQADAFPDPM